MRADAGAAGETRAPTLFGRNLNEGMTACWWRTFFPSLALFLLTGAFIVTKTGRDALYFERGGIADLAETYLLIAVLSAPSAWATLWLVRTAGPRRARVIGLVAMAIAQAGVALVVRPGGGLGMTLFFVGIPVLYGVLLSMAWLLGADLLDMAPKSVLARLYSTMGASSMMGGLTGAALAKSMARVATADQLLLTGAVGTLWAGLVCAWAHRTFPVSLHHPENPGGVPAPDGGEPPAPADLLRLLRQPYTALLAATGLVAAMVGVLIEFQFYWSAASSGRTGQENLMMFAEFYLALNAAAVVLQLFGAPAVQRWFGVHGSLLILPLAMVGATMLVWASASAAARAGLRVTEGGLKSSIHRSNWEQAYLPLVRGKRALAKILVDGIAARMGESLAAAILLFSFNSAQAMEGMNWLLVAGSASWLVLAMALRRSRRSPELIPEDDAELRADLPIPDG